MDSFVSKIPMHARDEVLSIMDKARTERELVNALDARFKEEREVEITIGGNTHTKVIDYPKWVDYVVIAWRERQRAAS